VPKFGYKFTGWEGDFHSASDTIYLTPNTYSNITARFVKDDSKSAVVINEINYNSSPDLDTGDWFEIFNNSSATTNLDGWYFKDEQDDNIFNFTGAGDIESGEYLVVCRDTSAFKVYFPEVRKIIGNFDFGLSNGGDIIRLFNAEGQLMDSVNYDDELPWDTLADGSGRTLSLTNPALDNNDYSNWKASGIIGGTPGIQNDVFVVSLEEEENLATDFRLEQNYPNPFNPATTINYTLPAVEQNSVSLNKQKRIRQSPASAADRPYKTQLKIYDMLGRKVATLVNEYQSPGNYEVRFDATNLSSGVYFYTLHAGDFIESKKMIFLK
jgi:hypothetical protein